MRMALYPLRRSASVLLHRGANEAAARGNHHERHDERIHDLRGESVLRDRGHLRDEVRRPNVCASFWQERVSWRSSSSSNSAEPWARACLKKTFASSYERSSLRWRTPSSAFSSYVVGNAWMSVFLIAI